jgi:integrase/recombinase XerD
MQFSEKNRALVERFQEFLSADRNLSRNTIEAYTKDVMKFLEFSNNSLAANISDYIQFLRDNDIRQSSIFRNMSSLRQFFLFLVDEKEIEKNPMDNIHMRHKNIPLPKILSESEMARLLSVFDMKSDRHMIRLKCMLHILYASGLRVSELVCLKIDSIVIDDESGRSTLVIMGKGGKERVVPLHDIALESVREYMPIRGSFHSKKAFSDFLFPSISRSEHITRHGFAKLLKKVAEEADIPASKISPHVVRHAFATHLLSNGADLLTIQKLLGHSNISTTQIYTHISDEKIRTLVEEHSNLKKLNVISSTD